MVWFGRVEMRSTFNGFNIRNDLYEMISSEGGQHKQDITHL